MKIITEFSKKVEHRREICNTCEHKKTNILNAEACNICGCIIYAKTLVPNTACPDTPPRWD